MPKVVAHVGRYDAQAFDGVSITVKGQCDALAGRGASVEVWQFEVGLEKVVQTESESGVLINRLPRFGAAALAALGVPACTKTWLRGRLDEIGFFHLHSVFSGQNNYIAGLGKPYAVTPQGGWSAQVIHGRRALLKSVWIRLFERRLWSSAAFVQAVSAKEAIDLKRLPEISRIEIVPNGIEVPRSSQTTDDRRTYWLFLGRIAVEQKGLDTLLKSYAAALRQAGDLPPLVIAGPDFRGGVGMLKSLAAGLGICGMVEFPGAVSGEAKAALFARAQLFVHPSRWEGQPLAILEALAHGVPCIVTQETGMGQWMEQNKCGWVTSHEAGALATHLEKLAKEPEQIRTRGANTRSAVSADFAWEKSADRLCLLYSQAMRTPPL